MSQEMPPPPAGDAQPERPTEMLAVTFFEIPCMAVRAQDGLISLSLRDMCMAIGLDLPSQRRRITRHPDLSVGLRAFRIPTSGGPQDSDFLRLELVSGWLTTINRARVGPEVAERLSYFTRFALQEVHNAVARVAGWAQGSSRQIEDLQDLGTFDATIREIAERQQALEESQSRARAAWKQLDTRIQALEQAARDGKLSVAHKGQIYHMVDVWAEQRAAREAIPIGQAKRGCWRALITRYRVAGYEEIPDKYFSDCVSFIQQQYRALTGADLALPSQAELDL